MTTVGAVRMMILQQTLMETAEQAGMMIMSLKDLTVAVVAMTQTISTQHHNAVHVVVVLVERLQNVLTEHWKQVHMTMR